MDYAAESGIRVEAIERDWIDPSSLHGLALPERRWIVPDWLPCGHVTLNYGDGGTGKTLLAQQLMTSVATGQPWCGLAVTQCRTFALFAEDEEDELHRRQAAICDAHGLAMSDLGDMRWNSGVGADNLLVTFDQDGRAQPTGLFAEIRARAREFGARLVIIDTAADTFGGNENNRNEVRQFVGRMLNDLAQHIGGAVLLNAHPSRSGMGKAGDMDGASTGWSNSARSRWSLARPVADEDEPSDPDARILTRRKANYASVGDTIKLRWQRGILAPVEAGGFAAAFQRQECEVVFLDLVARCDASNLPVSISRNAGNFAPKVFAKRPDRQGFTAKEFETAMGALMAANRITLLDYGRKGDQRRRIAVTQPTERPL
jgi:RecA-family ATPase